MSIYNKFIFNNNYKNQLSLIGRSNRVKRAYLQTPLWFIFCTN